MLSEAYLNVYTKGKALIYVEDQSDVSFWKSLFDKCSLGYKIFSVSKAPEALANGKNELIKLIPNLHSRLYIAIDSDLDFICKNRKPLIHQNIINNPHVLHTYVYNRENHEYSVFHTNECINKIFYTLIIENNFNSFITVYSEIAFKILCFTTFLIDNGIRFRAKNFNKYLVFKSNDFFYNSLAFENLAIKNLEELNNFILNNFIEVYESNELISHANYLNELGINIENAYQYINGHLLEKTILKFLKEYKCFLKHHEISEAESIYPEGKPRNQELNKITNHFDEKCSIPTLINSQGINWNCHIVNQIYADIMLLTKNHQSSI
jgi:hypothetical protein